MSTALTTNGLICGSSAAFSLTTSGLICQLLDVVVVPFVPTFIVGPQTVVPSDIYNKQQPGFFSSPAVLAKISGPSVISRRPINVVKVSPEISPVSEADVYNKKGGPFNKDSESIYNKQDPEITNNPKD